jgi:drug/metabolite transporter (DMT)-like permease
MAGQGGWHSFERLDAVFRISVNISIGAFTLAAVCWILGFTSVAVAGAVLATTAVLVALFSWFRRDDLRPGPPG